MRGTRRVADRLVGYTRRRGPATTPHRPGLVACVLAETLSATAASALALSVAGATARRGTLQPLNATSHWLNGTRAAHDARAGWRTTGVGLATHLAATGFWAVIYELWLRRGPRTRASVVGKAIAMAGVSAIVDYRATPRRFTPGWEFVLSTRAMTLVYLALGAGLAIGARSSRSRRRTRG